MDPHATSSVSLGLADCVLLALSGWIYWRVMGDLTRVCGKVRAQLFSLSDLLVCVVLTTFFAAIIVEAFWRGAAAAPEKIDVDMVLPGSALFLIMIGGIAGFLKWRGLRLREVFGADQLSFFRTLGWALGLILSAFPLVFATSLLTAWLLREGPPPQPMVALFTDAGRDADYGAMAKIFVAAVIIAPFCEEFIFRGYFYPVGKRYFGAWASGLATALLFAGTHLHLASLPSLFVLALCLTLAYERTGSLLVPIGMHAFFNFTSLLVLYLQGQKVLA